MNRRLQVFYEKLGPFYSVFIIAILSGLIALIGYHHVQPRSYDFKVNHVSDVTILAPSTMEDSYQTQLNRQRAREAIADIYVFQEDLLEIERDRLDQFFSYVREWKNRTYTQSQLVELIKDKGPDQSIDLEQIKQYLPEASQSLSFDELSPSLQSVLAQLVFLDPPADLQALIDQLRQDNLRLLLLLDAQDLDLLQDELLQVIKDTMSQELSASQLGQELLNIRTQMAAGSLPLELQQLALNILSYSIKPTLIYSESETKRLKDEAEANVQTSYILQGQVIIQAGHVIKPTNLRQLELYGYLNRQKNSMKIWVFLGLILIHGLLLVRLFYVGFDRSDLDQKSKNLTAYAIILAGALLSIELSQWLQIHHFLYANLLVPMAVFPLLLYTKTNLKHSLLFVLVVHIFAIFVLTNNESQTLVIYVSLFYLLSSLLTVIYILWQGEIKRSFRRQRFFLYTLLGQLLLAIPIMSALSIPVNSKQVLWILASTVLSNLLGFLIWVLLEPYYDQLLSSRSPMTLNQLANLNHPLLKRLIEKAPGTYHHSMMVANLAANAVETIGGDSLLTRVAAYYHDVGKTIHPLFFVENLSGGIESPHQMLTPQESSQVIIDHVTEGVRLLQEEGLPQSIIDICQQHHGTTSTQYFYYQAKETDPTVEEADFRYPGPIPQTKEAAITMIADSMEAASRTLKHYDQTSIENLLDQIIQSKLKDGQFADCQLTADELLKVRQSIIKGIASMYHTRIEYPH